MLRLPPSGCHAPDVIAARLRVVPRSSLRLIGRIIFHGAFTQGTVYSRR